MASSLIWTTALLHPWRRHAAAPALGPGALVEPGERTLMRAGAGALATDRALYVRNEIGAWRRAAWDSIATVGWSVNERRLVLRTWTSTEDQHVAASAALAALAAERVTSTQLLVTAAQLPDGTPVTVVAVRASSGGEVRWRARLSDGRAADEATLAQCRPLIADVRRAAGL